MLKLSYNIIECESLNFNFEINNLMLLLLRSMNVLKEKNILFFGPSVPI